ncbi:hypothetical protein TCAL_05213 [Tigriopus californicus]|uniref:Uncharacterized protein n=1 Tax=Tigriopus californicus TaxID=6832 RepID=A0A553NWY2_TIGCA|nr:hypothetical protein TCAL_05213 [Tigriopus californicus]|eukprot:TCALIF_05213-PA protein Name:"Protein of unknown function" AED:0.44 eAED:0.44 QI:141/1/0.5/1/1/1/2/0/120
MALVSSAPGFGEGSSMQISNGQESLTSTEDFLSDESLGSIEIDPDSIQPQSGMFATKDSIEQGALNSRRHAHNCSRHQNPVSKSHAGIRSNSYEAAAKQSTTNPNVIFRRPAEMAPGILY